ncbi:Serine phosphatase RsbU, regulator of sigma subunit [Ectothiorhodospira magna]|uniref:Serine phosphatase RsbU, regulator of sigma subunit n=1 Tax=Ectothiorhodospira magna TaxID=867345 RepID=A0A1H9F2L4_9GAMM|nr:biofilm regulation protein phosphatase SiaA [Ectothiorhodospira magna]SEQ32210.1 Serine phosphatase RsbU, regulator of sigma subunit [Ectothiorhodospira magna]
MSLIDLSMASDSSKDTVAGGGPGLRARSVLALALAGLIVLLPAGILGWYALETVRQYFGQGFAENFTRLHRERILAPVTRDLALSMRLADSRLTYRFLLDEDAPQARTDFFEEAEGYRQDFRSRSYFIISLASKHYYFNDDGSLQQTPRYRLSPDRPEDAWFFALLEQGVSHNINVNHDLQLGTTRVWLNVMVTDQAGEPIGMAGTGLELGEFLADFIQDRPPGVTPMILDGNGALQAHPDPALISFASTTVGGDGMLTLFSRLPQAVDQERLEQAMGQAQANLDQVPLFTARLDGRDQLLALAYLPELDWYVVVAVDLAAAGVIQRTWLWSGLLAIGGILVLLLTGFALAVDRTVLRPLRRLQQSATVMSQGRYDIRLPPSGGGEIGDLTRAFERMAEQVRQHTRELEYRVQDRTAELRRANEEMAQAQRQIKDSIDYASLIQRAILPDHRMAALLGAHHFVLWRPRDVVGGDFYLFHNEGDRYLIGIVDCAGHGVAGALMTMLARAALDQAISSQGMASPAALLTQADHSIRDMLGDSEARGVATHMDVGLAFVDRHQGVLRYAGARIGLYHSDGHTVEVIKGGRRALGDRRRGRYDDVELALNPASTYYLVTDGYLDQSGGDMGFGLGSSLFMKLLIDHARLPLSEQAQALNQALDDYRGHHEQRDDVTVLAFRVDQDASTRFHH